MLLRLVTVTLLAVITVVLADPTMYKRNEQNLYEPGERWTRHENISISDVAKKNVNDVFMSILRSTLGPPTHLLNLAYFHLLKSLNVFRPHRSIVDRYA